MESLGSRTAVLGQPLCKFLFADNPGGSANLRLWLPEVRTGKLLWGLRVKDVMSTYSYTVDPNWIR